MSKKDHQKLKESLKIFDFGSDSDSGEEGETGEGVVVKKPVKPKCPPPVAKETDKKREVKGEQETRKQPNKPNVRCGTVHLNTVCIYTTKNLKSNRYWRRTDSRLSAQLSRAPWARARFGIEAAFKIYTCPVVLSAT